MHPSRVPTGILSPQRLKGFPEIGRMIVSGPKGPPAFGVVGFDHETIQRQAVRSFDFVCDRLFSCINMPSRLAIGEKAWAALQGSRSSSINYLACGVLFSR